MSTSVYSLPRPRPSCRLGGLFGLSVAVALFAVGCVLALSGQDGSRVTPSAAAARPGPHTPDLVATEHYVFVLAGPTLYQFEAGSLKLKNQIEIPPAKAPEVDPNGRQGNKSPRKPPAQ